jgi:hypothetical protein
MEKAKHCWTSFPAMQELPINSVIASVERTSVGNGYTTGLQNGNMNGYANGHANGHASTNDAKLIVKGYAVADVSFIELSSNRGKTWTRCDITYREGKWSWVLWSAVLDLRTAAASCSMESSIDELAYSVSKSYINVSGSVSDVEWEMIELNLYRSQTNEKMDGSFVRVDVEKEGETEADDTEEAVNVEIWSRATSHDGEKQPIENTWNLRGFAYNAVDKWKGRV